MNISSCLKCFGAGLAVGALGAGGAAWAWSATHAGRALPITAPPTVIKVPVIVYKTLKAAAPIPSAARHNAAVQVIAERRIDRRLAVATINTHTGVGALDITPRPFISFRPRTTIAALYGLANGAPAARLLVTQRLARIGPVDVIAQGGLDDAMSVPGGGASAYAGVGLAAHFSP
ncbi:MAG: hypothetical protein ACYCXG_11730 [Acidiferrobacter sp.]